MAIGLAAVLSAVGSRSGADHGLAGRPPAAAVVAAALGAPWVAQWWAEDRDRALEISGGDLLAAGVVAGPAVGRALRAARAQMLDGVANTREQQLAAAIEAAR